MAFRLVVLPVGAGEADGASMVGKVGVVYNDYASALANDGTDLSEVRSWNRLTGAAGAAVTQTPATATAATAGVEVGTDGNWVAALNDDADELYITFPDSGRMVQPRRLVIPRQDDASSSSSSSSSESSSSSSLSSSSSSSLSSSSSSSSSP